MNKNKRLTTCFCAAVALSILEFLAMPDVAQAAGADTLGHWSTLPYQMPINPIHVALLDNGKVLVVAGSENDPSSKWHRAAIWDWDQSSAPVARNIAWDLFCNAMSFLPDGRVLITGGTERYDPFYGESYAIIADPDAPFLGDTFFTEGDEMAEGRWYPTNTVLGDGRTVTISGRTRTGAVSKTIEIFDPATGSWSPTYKIPFTPKLYPWGHLLPNGKVIYVGPDATSRMLDPDKLTWNTVAVRSGGIRTYGSSVLLPLRPENDYAANVLIMGGHKPATKKAERIDLSKPAPTWQSVQSMAYARINLNSTLLPTGEVLVTGGAPKENVDNVNTRKAELFDPVTNTWRTLANAAYSRHYHSVALLLPDATVWTAGSNPTRGTYRKEMEIFEPPYLFTTNAGQVISAPRPSITTVPSIISYGKPFDIGTADTNEIADVVLVRPGAVTHARDMEQRLVGLDFTKSSSTKLSVTAPPHGDVAPPGYYMLFLINVEGVPSVAKFVRIGL